MVVLNFLLKLWNALLVMGFGGFALKVMGLCYLGAAEAVRLRVTFGAKLGLSITLQYCSRRPRVRLALAIRVQPNKAFRGAKYKASHNQSICRCPLDSSSFMSRNPFRLAQPGSFGELGKIPRLGEIRGFTTFSESHLAVWYSNVRKNPSPGYETFLIIYDMRGLEPAEAFCIHSSP